MGCPPPSLPLPDFGDDFVMRARWLGRERFDCQPYFHWAQRQGLVQRHCPIVFERSSCNVSSLHSYLHLLKLYAKTDVMPMVNSTRTTRFRFWLGLIRVIGVIVPRRLRADWRQEWEAELRHREALLAEWDRLDWRNKLDLLWRSTSALLDALWLQPKRLEDEMFQDLRYGVRMLLKGKGFTATAVLSPCAGHRREYGDLQSGERRIVASAASAATRRPGRDHSRRRNER